MQKEVAVITGGTSGIGAAYTRYYASMGYDLLVTGHPGDKEYPHLEEIAEKFNIKVELMLADFAIKEDLVRVEETIRDKNVSVLINSAGFGLGRPFWEDDVQTLENMVMVHIIAPVRFIYAVLPQMISRKKGTIISLSSLSSFIPIPLDSMYSATKIFHNSFLQSLHISFRNQGIKAQVLCPGFVKTNFHKNAGTDTSLMQKKQFLPWMNPERVVEISIRNLEKKNKVIVIPGLRNKLIKLLYTMIPKPLYYRLAVKYLV